ncbi:AMP-binding protein [Salinarimonas rosea]|uniref:AMP-binding protein n=1 Tax=Salinarimonas rosea TaxID=552063 RepID=UPI0003FA16E0|nr:AMP-binding protein [Salinarimonas rosea]
MAATAIEGAREAGGARDHATAATAVTARPAGLGGLFAERAAQTPGVLAFVDQAGREAWCGRPRIAWSYGAALPMIERLAAFFAGLGLAPEAPVAVCLPAGSETLLTLLALERAGLTPCLLPLAWPRDDLARAVEATGAVAVVTQSAVGALKPAETFRDIAMGYYGLRFVTAFGPQPPDGVLDLDRVMIDERPILAGGGESAGDRAGRTPEGSAAREPGIVTLALRGAEIEAAFRPASSWIAAARAFLEVAQYQPHERIVHLVAPDDLMGLATGFVAALLTGAPLELHGLFDGPALAASLARGEPTRLVAPGWMEGALAATALPASVRGLVLLHAAPTRFRARAAAAGPIVDVLALEPWALLTHPRARGGQVALRLDARSGADADPLVRRDDEGRLSVRGASTQARRVVRGQVEADLPDWRETSWRADVFAGIVIGVS